MFQTRSVAAPVAGIDTGDRAVVPPGTPLHAQNARAGTVASVLVIIALLIAAVHFVVTVSDYSKVFVHPDWYITLLPNAVRDGLAFGVHDLVNVFYPLFLAEFRPRWITHLIQMVDQKLRLHLYLWIPVHPTFSPVAWFFQLVVAPYLLYRSLAGLTKDRTAALAGVAVFVSATGFLSGFTMSLFPGKALTCACFIGAFYFASRAVEQLSPRQTVVESRGVSKYLLLVAVLIGLFVDEMPIASLMLIPLTFWPHFWPTPPWPGRFRAVTVNAGFFVLPVVMFLLIVVVIMPPIIERWHGYKFDYLGETFLTNAERRTGTSLIQGRFADLTPWTVTDNVTTLFGLSLLPRQISELTPSPYGEYPGGQVNNLPKIVVLMAFFGVALFVAWRARTSYVQFYRGYLVALGLFFVFLTALSIRHIPIVTGYYYGAGFAALFAILIGLLFAGLSQLAPRARPFAGLAVIAIVAVQVTNFGPINDGWIYTHNELWARRLVSEMRPGLQRRTPLTPQTPSQPLSTTEVNGIWAAWKRDRMDQYTRDHRMTPAALYEVLELRALTRATRNDDDDD